MTSTSPTPLPVLQQPERCCPIGQCDYSPSKVRAILSFIRHMREFGADPGEATVGRRGDSEASGGGAAGGSGLAHKAARIWDVQQAQSALGGRPSAEALSEKLCPYGPIEDES